MRRSIGRAGATALAVVGWLATGAPVHAAPPDADPVVIADAFVEWASAQGSTVGAPACDLPTAGEAPFAVCYGVGADAVLVAVVALDDGGAPIEVVALPLPLVAVPPEDTAVESTGGGPVTSFGPGPQEVGVDIEPGTYATLVPAGGTCYWERVSGFDGELSDSIANGSSAAGDLAIVGVAPSDAGIVSDGCGTWTMVAA